MWKEQQEQLFENQVNIVLNWAEKRKSILRNFNGTSKNFVTENTDIEERWLLNRDLFTYQVTVIK